MCELESKHMNDKSKTKYKRYDEAFKREAVEHWLVSGKSARQIASELGINEQSLKVWKQKFEQGPARAVAPTLDALQAENRRLQRELRRAQEQRDMLKKLWASSPHRARALCEDRGHAGRTLHCRPVRRAGRVAQRLPRLGGTRTGTTRPGQHRALAAHRTGLPGEPADLRPSAHPPNHWRMRRLP